LLTVISRMLTSSLKIGMFLFAKLVIENFYKQTKRKNLTKELEPNKFPNSLEEA
jgi:hypothetical protein